MKRLKNLLAVAAILLAAMVGYSLPHPRFERILHEEHTEFKESWHMFTFEVWHDRETGDETVCAMNTSFAATSCWKTGRNWKD